LQPGVHFARDGADNAKIELVNLLGTPYIDFTNDGVSDFDARLRLTANDSLAIEGANVGIGTTNPANRLSVASGNADFLGNVGIGTTTPQARLDVRGDIRLGPSGLFRATSGEENLRIVRGWVGGSGVILGGSGFAVTQLSKGDYLITFNTPFASTPSVTATVDDETDSLVIIDFYVAGIFAPNASSVRVRVRQHSDAQGICNCVDNQRFQFIAIGPR
jgi:hypothetical protein